MTAVNTVAGVVALAMAFSTEDKDAAVTGGTEWIDFTVDIPKIRKIRKIASRSKTTFACEETVARI